MYDQAYIDNALYTVNETLKQKKEAWTNSAPVFESFEIAQEFGVTPLQFALLMCRLKMNRLKNRWKASEAGESFAPDDDAADSLKDLACYAILGMALLEREKQSNPNKDVFLEETRTETLKTGCGVCYEMEKKCQTEDALRES